MTDRPDIPEEAEVGSGIKGPYSVVEALRRDRPRTAHGYVHVGPALLEEAADQIEKLQAAAPALRKQGAEEAAERIESLRRQLRCADGSGTDCERRVLAVEAERDQALAKGAEEGKRRARKIAAERLADLWNQGAISERHRWYVLNAIDEREGDDA